jgi:hypothetical protein
MLVGEQTWIRSTRTSKAGVLVPTEILIVARTGARPLSREGSSARGA